MGLGEDLMNDFAYEYEQSLEEWDIECMLDKAIEEYEEKARTVAEILRMRERKNVQR